MTGFQCKLRFLILNMVVRLHPIVGVSSLTRRSGKADGLPQPEIKLNTQSGNHTALYL